MKLVRVGAGVLAAVAVVAAAGCSKDTAQEASTVTVKETVTSTVPASGSTSPSTSAVDADASGAASSSVELTKAIRAIEIETQNTAYGTRVGPERYQLTSGGLSIRFSWRSKGENGDLTSSDCIVVADLTGPGVNERRRSDSCTSSSPGDSIRIKSPGKFTVAISITPPGGGTPATKKHTFEVLGAGA